MGEVRRLPTPATAVYEEHAGHEVRAQKAAEAHLAACQEAMFAADEIENPEEWPASPSIAPFCGCDTCVIREVLHAAWPHVMAAAREELHADERVTCKDCSRTTTRREAELRSFSTGRCVCGGLLR